MDTLQYLLSPNFQVLGESGKPLVGGYVEVYLHNTTTKVITKRDFDGTLNEFKVELNSLGMATILVEIGNSYDVYCFDSFGALRWSRKNLEKTMMSADYPIVIDVENDRIYIAENGIGRNLLKNAHNLVPDSRYLKFTDFSGDVVVSLCDKLTNWLSTQGFVP